MLLINTLEVYAALLERKKNAKSHNPNFNLHNMVNPELTC